MLRNVELCKARGLPEWKYADNRPPLAVVGGGNSALEHIEELKTWKGDIWASGSVFHWLQDHGIEATLFCVDPQPCLSGMAAGAKKALLASNCDPSAFEVLRDAEVTVFDLVKDGVGINHGPTTGSASFDLSVKMGYRDVSYFGFDSCYRNTERGDEKIMRVWHKTHAFKNEEDTTLMRVVCDGKAFITGAEFFMQAEWMAGVFNAVPQIFKNRSDGLLAAMINDPDYDCTHMSATMAAKLTPDGAEEVMFKAKAA